MSAKTAIVSEPEIFLEMDNLDQQQIILAATGEVVDELVYEVRGEYGLSWAGINHIAFWMGDIKTETWVQWERFSMFGDRAYWSATVRAINEKYNLASLGTAEVPEMIEVYNRDSKGSKIPDGKGGFLKHLEPDPFCRRKALSMAQRNAKRAVTPEAVLKKWLQYFVDKKKGKEAEVPFSPKVVEAEYTVTENDPEPEEDSENDSKGKKKRERKPKIKTDPDEERVKQTLEANGLDTNCLVIVKYEKKLLIMPRSPEFTQDRFEEYNQVINKLIHAKWVPKEGRWQV